LPSRPFAFAAFLADGSAVIGEAKFLEKAIFLEYSLSSGRTRRAPERSPAGPCAAACPNLHFVRRNLDLVTGIEEVFKVERGSDIVRL
jgi:hypothetical protein